MSFKRTEEQEDIIKTIDSSDDVVTINAYAGSGKTSTLIELVKEIRKTDKTSKILYLVFNRGMVDDSKRKFEENNLNVDCFTTHSFALRRMTAIKGEGEFLKVMPNLDYTEYMKLKEKNISYKYVRYKCVLDMFNAYCMTFDDMDRFCNNLSDTPSIYELGDSNIKPVEIKFFRELYEKFIKEKKYMHNMYLKEYSCNCHDWIRGYRYVLLDEAQDLNPFMLNIINRIKRDKMWVVGDDKQSIYSFMKSINSMSKHKGPKLPLSISFRFNDEVCKVANDILSFKYKDFKHGSIKNFHNITEITNKSEKAIIFRKNSTMFEYAVRLVKDLDDVKVKFMDVVGGNNSDSFDDTFSEMLYFYDKLLESKLSSDNEMLKEYRSKFKIQRSKIVDSYIKIAEKEGSSLYRYLLHGGSAMMSLDFQKFFKFFDMNECDLVNVLERLRNSENCLNPRKTYILITAHRSKGLEWEHVKIADDVWTLNSDDEANLLYVAVTRAKHKLEHQVVDTVLEFAREQELDKV